MNSDSQRLNLGLIAAALAVLLFPVAVELGAISAHSSNTSFNNRVVTQKTSASSPASGTTRCQTQWDVDRDATWAWPIWLGVYQSHGATATTVVTWTSQGDCARKGTATITTTFDITCRGLRAVRDCRGELDKQIDEQIAEIKQKVLED